MITVEKIDDRTYTVIVNGSTKTTHQVTVEADYAEKLCAGNATTERLLIASFEFLLQREPNTSILRSFSLPVINQCFPEYESSIGQLL